MEYAVVGTSCGDVAYAVVELVETVLLLHLHLAQVTLGEGQFAALAYGDDVLDAGVGHQQRSREEEPAGLGGRDVGRREALAQLVDELSESLFVLQEGDDVNEYDSLFGKVVVKFQGIFHLLWRLGSAGVPAD